VSKMTKAEAARILGISLKEFNAYREGCLRRQKEREAVMAMKNALEFIDMEENRGNIDYKKKATEIRQKGREALKLAKEAGL